MADTQPKLIVAIGSSPGVGTTTIANYTAVDIARRGFLTLLIEFRTTTGFSVYMQRGLHESQKSLCEVMAIPEKLSENTIKSAHSSNLFYTCLNFRDDSLKMKNYQAFNLTAIISEAKKLFDYIILDLPADFREPAVATVLSRDFVHKSSLMVVVDEKATTYKYLNDFNSILELAGESNNPKETTFILNSIEASHYQDYIIDYLPSLPITKPVNVVYFPYIEGLTVACNKGAIYEVGINQRTKKFFEQVELLADIFEHDLKSEFSDIKSAELEDEAPKGFLDSIFGSITGKKSKKKGKKKNKKKGKQSKFDDIADIPTDFLEQTPDGDTQYGDETQYNDTQYNEAQYSDTQYNDTQYDAPQYSDTQYNGTQYDDTQYGTEDNQGYYEYEDTQNQDTNGGYDNWDDSIEEFDFDDDPNK